MITTGSYGKLRDMVDLDDGDGGEWLEINNGKHAAAALVVTRMSSDTKSPEQEAFAKLLLNAENLADALECILDLYDASGLQDNTYARKLARRVLNEIGRRK